MKIKSIKVIKGKNKWSESKDKLIHMVLDLGEYEQKPSNKIEGFYERIKEYLPSLKSHRCSEGKPGGFFKRIKEGTWMGHIIEHVALELQTLAGYDTGWGRTRGVKGEKGVYNVVFNYEDEDKGKLAAKEAVNVVKDIINDNNPQIDKIVKKLKSKSLKESIQRILREETKNRGRSKLINIIKNISLDAAINTVSTEKNLLRILDVNTPMELLNIFDDLKQVQSVDHKWMVLYRYKPGHNIFVYDKAKNEGYIDYILWGIMRSYFDLDYFGVQEICMKWIEQTYGLKTNYIYSSYNGQEENIL